MRASIVTGFVAASGLLFTNVLAAANARDENIVVTTTSDAIELAVPASALSLRIPKGDLAPVTESKSAGQASPRYFHLEDAGRGLVLSGWFEPAQSFKGFETFWLTEFSAMKRAGLIPTAAPTLVEVGDWSGAAYEIKVPGGAGKVINTHIRAELVRAGTWIDLHISITSRKPLADARTEALEFLKSIVVNEKG